MGHHVRSQSQSLNNSYLQSFHLHYKRVIHEYVRREADESKTLEPDLRGPLNLSGGWNSLIFINQAAIKVVISLAPNPEEINDNQVNYNHAKNV